MIYSNLFAKMQAALETVSAIKVIYDYPTTKIEKYPAAMYFPVSLDSAYNSTADNKKRYTFRLFIIVGATQKERVDIFSNVLPKAVDAVIAALDAAWDGGTIDGHRVWCTVTSGQWSMGVAQAGLEATAELTVDFQLLTDN